jgi:hypothetical protein
VQGGVGGDKVAAICIHRARLALRPGFVADKSIDFSNLWAHGGFLPHGVARSPSGADQRRSTNMTSKFQWSGRSLGTGRLLERKDTVR